MATRTHAHYQKLLASNPNASVGFTLAAQAVYAARNGEFDPNADDHNDEEYRNIARSLKQRYGENLTREQVETEMQAPETFPARLNRRHTNWRGSNLPVPRKTQAVPDEEK